MFMLSHQNISFIIIQKKLFSANGVLGEDGGRDGDPLADLEANGVLGEEGGRDGDPLADLEANGVLGEEGGRDGDPLAHLDRHFAALLAIIK